MPCEFTRRFGTVAPRQTKMLFKVCEGESDRASQNLLLSEEFGLTDLTPMAAEECKADVTLSIDINGILHLSAQEVEKEANKMDALIDPAVQREFPLPPERGQADDATAEWRRSADRASLSVRVALLLFHASALMEGADIAVTARLQGVVAALAAMADQDPASLSLETVSAREGDVYKAVRESGVRPIPAWVKG